MQEIKMNSVFKWMSLKALTWAVSVLWCGLDGWYLQYASVSLCTSLMMLFVYMCPLSDSGYKMKIVTLYNNPNHDITIRHYHRLCASQLEVKSGGWFLFSFLRTSHSSSCSFPVFCRFCNHLEVVPYWRLAMAASCNEF